MANRSRGLLTIEYVLLISILIAAVVVMSMYVKRSLCGKWREVGDTFGYGRQY
jgi:hypothetical protein